jgi:hypothetical protein
MAILLEVQHDRHALSSRGASGSYREVIAEKHWESQQTVTVHVAVSHFDAPSNPNQ